MLPRSTARSRVSVGFPVAPVAGSAMTPAQLGPLGDRRVVRLDLAEVGRSNAPRRWYSSGTMTSMLPSRPGRYVASVVRVEPLRSTRGPEIERVTAGGKIGRPGVDQGRWQSAAVARSTLRPRAERTAPPRSSSTPQGQQAPGPSEPGGRDQRDADHQEASGGEAAAGTRAQVVGDSQAGQAQPDQDRRPAAGAWLSGVWASLERAGRSGGRAGW